MKDKEALAAVVALSMTELAKLALQLYFAQMTMAGQSAEAMEQLYQATKAEFMDRHPDTLKEV